MEDIDFSKVEFEWHNKKSERIKRERGLSFDEIVEKIREGAVLDILDNREEFEGQKLMILNIDGYIWAVPFEKRGDKLRLVTAYPSRKFTRIYLEGKK